MEENAGASGRYITFRLAGREYAMDAGRVRGIVPAHTLIPAGEPTLADPAWLSGFVIFESKALPVIDLGGKLGLRGGSGGRDPYVIVVEAGTPVGPRLAGFVAERVSDLVHARARDFRGGKLRMGRPRVLLDADAVLAEESAPRVAR